MKKADLNQKQACDTGQDHNKAATTHLTHIHSVLDNCQNHSSSLQELFCFTTRNCSLFNTIPPPPVGKETPWSLSEAEGRNLSAAAPWKDLFYLHSSEKGSLDRVSRCINSISVMGWLEKSCSFAGDFSSRYLGDNFICFAHFWLENLEYNKNLPLLELEMSSSKEDELHLGFRKELKLDGLPDARSVPVALLNTYATRLLNNQKLCFFLCYLNLLSSERTPGYRQMLSNIQYETNHFHIIQLVISVLAFALAGLLFAVVKVKKY